MGISKTIVFPFSIDSLYFEGYAWAMELALRMDVRLQLFTTAPSGSSEVVYQSLLAAQGYYLHHFRHDKKLVDKAKQEQHIVHGELSEELISYLKKSTPGILIIDPVFYSNHSQELREILKESGGAIILKRAQDDQVSPLSPPSITDHFYNQLRNAEFYKIPENFFNMLGHDRSVFNYLRKFFQKNRGS